MLIEDPFSYEMRQASEDDLDAAKKRRQGPGYRKAILAAVALDYRDDTGQRLRDLWNTYGFVCISDFIVEAHIEMEALCPQQFRTMFGTPEPRRWIGDLFSEKQKLNAAFEMQRQAEENDEDDRSFREIVTSSDRMFTIMERWQTVFAEVSRTIRQPGDQRNAARAVVMRYITSLIQDNELTPEDSHALIAGGMHAHVLVGVLRDFCRRYAAHLLDDMDASDRYVNEISKIMHDAKIIERITRK